MLALLQIDYYPAHLNLSDSNSTETETYVFQCVVFLLFLPFAVLGNQSPFCNYRTGLSNDGKVFLNLFFLGVDISMICVVIYFLASQEHVGSISVVNFEYRL